MRGYVPGRSFLNGLPKSYLIPFIILFILTVIRNFSILFALPLPPSYMPTPTERVVLSAEMCVFSAVLQCTQLDS